MGLKSQEFNVKTTSEVECFNLLVMSVLIEEREEAQSDYSVKH